MTPAPGQPLRQPKRGRDVDPDFHRGDGVGPSPTRLSGPPPVIPANAGIHAPHAANQFHTPHSKFPIPPPPPVIPANAGIHAPPSPQGQRVDSSLRPTAETAEARKGRGPRFSSGRRGRAIPPPSFRPPTRHSGESRNPRTQTNHSSHPPLTPAVATAYTPWWFPCDTSAVPLRHSSQTPAALPGSGPVLGVASVILSRFRPDSVPNLSKGSCVG